MKKNKLGYYFIREFLKNYFSILLAFGIIIWITQAVRLLDLITEDGNSLSVYFLYILLFLPKIISKISIIIFFICLIITIARFEENNELRALWLSGLDKKKFIYNLLKYSILFVLILILIRLFIVPYFSNYSRYLLLNSNVGSIAPLIKENNFNSPLKKITIYVGKKNQINELDDIILFENSNKETKTIIAKSGSIINENNKNLLVLVNGSIHQESNNKISILDFDKITLVLDQYSKKSADYYKFDEMLTFELIEKIKENNKINTNIINVLNDRIIIPLFIPSLVLLGFFLLSVNRDFFNYFILKIIIFTAGILIIIFSEILLNLTIKNIYINFFLYSGPLFFFIINWLLLNHTLRYKQ